MKRESVAYYIFDKNKQCVGVVSKSALTRSKKRMSFEAGSVNYVTSRNPYEVKD